MKNPCFQFSIDIATGESRVALFKWLEHFRSTGMPAGFVVNGDICSVWRAGKRNGQDIDKPVGILEDFVNGFDDIWRLNGGTVANHGKRRVGVY